MLFANFGGGGMVSVVHQSMQETAASTIGKVFDALGLFVEQGQVEVWEG